MFGGASAQGTRLVDSGTIRAQTPMNAVGTVDVTVINPNGQRAVLSRAFTFESVALPTLTVSATIVSPGGQISVSWTTALAGPLDWIALHAVNSPGGDGFWWQYTGGAKSGTFTLNAPGQVGQYEFRFLPDDDYMDVARSPVVTVR